MPTAVLLRSLILTISVTMAFTLAYFYSIRSAAARMQPLLISRQQRPWITTDALGQDALAVSGYGFTPLGAVELYVEHEGGAVRWLGTALASIDGEFRFDWRHPATESRLVRAVDQASHYRGATQLL